MGDSYINFTIWTRGLQLVLSRVSLGLVIMVLGGGVFASSIISTYRGRCQGSERLGACVVGPP